MHISNHSAEKAQEIASAQHARELLRKQSRTNRRHLREKRRIAAKSVQGKSVGAADYKATDKGFIKKNRLPGHFNQLINAARQWVYSQRSYTDKNGVIHSLTSRGKRKLFEVIVVLLTNCDLMSGQVGKALALHMDTIKHDALMLEHAKRFEYSMCSTSWYDYIRILKAMNVFIGREIKLYGSDGVTVRSVASYKWLSNDFLRKIGVYKDSIMASIKLAYQKAIDNGRSFVWRQYNAPTVQSPSDDLFTAYSPSTTPPQ